MVKRKKSKLGKIIYVLIILFLITVIVISGIKIGQFLIDWHEDSNTSKEVQKLVINTIKQDNDDPQSEFTHKAWDQLYAQNQDFIGYMVFPDGFCSQPIVQAKDNDYYLRRNFITKQYSTQGTVFMDYRDTVDSQNITVYGHHVFYDQNAMFTPISKLVNQNVYDQHHEFNVYYKDSVASYVITNVYIYNISTANEYSFAQPDFYDDYTVLDHIKFANQNNRIKPVDTVDSTNDRLFTMQTCATTNTNDRTIIVAKEVSRKEY